MRFRTTSTLSVGILVAGLLAACSGGSAATGKAIFALSDAAADMGAVTKVNITVDSIKVHASGGAWATVATTTRTYDLLELKAKGTAKLVAESNLGAKAYDQLELGISKVVVTDNKGEHEAKLPSNKLQFKALLDVKANSTATANFDVLADQSLHVTGNGQYILAPVVKLETRSNAQVTANANNEVTINGGTTTTTATVGMDIEGNVGAGLSISTDAVLTIGGSGKVQQSSGKAVVAGTVKSVTATGVIITTKSGQDVEVRSSGNASAQQGSEVIVTYDAASKVASQIETKAQAEARLIVIIGGSSGPTTVPPPTATRAPTATPGPNTGATAVAGANATVTGTLKSVDAARGMIVLTTQAGAELTLSVSASAKVTADGAASTIAALATKLGSRITAEYNSSTNVASSVSAQAQASASATVNGTLKAANAVLNSVTVTAQNGTELALTLTSQSKITVNGSASSSAALATMIGKACTVEYNAETKAVVSLDVKA